MPHKAFYQPLMPICPATAFTHLPQMVGCCLLEPTSVSQCQHRSHFSPAAFETVTATVVSLVVLISSCDTFNSSRSSSEWLFAFCSKVAGPVKASFASSALPMCF